VPYSSLFSCLSKLAGGGIKNLSLHRQTGRQYRGYGATTPSHLGRKLAGPLCTAFSSARRPQRHLHVKRRESPLVARNGSGREMADKFGRGTRLPRNFQGSLTCCKSATWDRRLYFPSKGRRAKDFFT